mgnify:CR=1 FL=1
MKKTLSLLALLTVMFTSAWADEVTVTWPMGESTEAVAAPENSATGEYILGSGLVAQTSTRKWSDITFTQVAGGSTQPSTYSAAVEANCYLEFKVTPTGMFTPTNVSFDIIKIGTDAPYIYVDVIDGDGQTINVVSSNTAIRRNNDTDATQINHSYSVSGAAASSNAASLRIYVAKLASNKGVGIANVVIEGTSISSDAPIISATSNVLLKSFPLQPKPEATISLTGKNLADGTYDAPVPTSEGLSIEPTQFTVADGSLSQVFTLTYAPTVDAATTEELKFVVGDMTATTSVELQARINAYEQTIVSEAASWDWTQLSEEITLTEESVPSINDDFVFKELEDQINFGSFDAQSIVISKTQFPVRKGKFQNGTIKFKASVPGVITVDFSDTGSSGDGVKRYLRVNGVDTEYYTQRDGTSDRKVSGEIEVPAGEVSICGWDPEAEVKDEEGNVIGTGANVPIQIFKVTFEPKEIVAETANFDFTSETIRENIGTALADVAGYIYNETFTAGDVTLQITAGSAPSRIYTDANRGQCLVTYMQYTTLTFRAPEGKAITQIEFTAAGNSNINKLTPSSGAVEGMTWTGNADGVRFAQGATSYLANAIVTLTDATDATAALPAIEYTEVANIAAFNALEAGTYAKLTLTDAEVIGKSADGYSTVFIQDATGGAWIQYTSLNEGLAEQTKVNGTVYTVKRNDVGKDAHLKEAEDTPESSIESSEIADYTVYSCATIAEAAEHVNQLVKIEGATFTATSATAGTITLGEETIKVNNGGATANQQLHKMDDFTKDETWENVTVIGINTITYGILPLSMEIAGVTEAGEELNVERYPGMGYSTTTATVDFTAAKEFLGVEEVTTNMLHIVNPDGTEISNYATYDGWFNGEGAAETWGDNTKINVKFFEAIPDGEYSICDMNGADELDATYTVKWALKANGKTYTYTINVTFVEAPVVELQKSDLSIVASVEYPVNCGSYQEQVVSLSDEDVQSILTELGIESLDAADVYGYNPTTGELLSNYAGYDGWRDANGDFAFHSGNSTVPACVKYDDGQNYYCYSIAGCEEQTVKTYWAIANAEKYVLVEIDFIYGEAEAIEREIVDLGISTSVTYDVNEDSYTEKVASITEEQLQQILAALELQSLEDDACEVFVYNPTTKELANDNFDGWRDANGDSHAWAGDANAPACVKFSDGLNYYCYNLNGMSAGTIATYWAIANDTKAVLVKIDFIYEGIVDGINAITAAHSGEAIYNLQGVRLEKLQKGLNIVGGKKIVVK